jgi:TonB family protein
MISGTIADSDAVAAALDEADARTPDLLILAERPARQIAGTLLACTAAIGLHGGVALGLWYGITDRIEENGGKGIGREAIGIDIIDSKVFAALRAESLSGRGASDGLAAIAGVAQPEAASTETLDAAAAKPEQAKAVAMPDIIIPDFEERPEPPTPNTLSIATQAPVIEQPLAQSELVTTQPAAGKVASLPATAAVEAVQGGAVSQAAVPVPEFASAPADAARGAAKAFGRDVMAALIATLPKPRLGFGNGTAGRLTGTVVIEFVLALDGSIERAVVATPSGHIELDTSALAAVRATQFPKPPEGLPANERWYTMPYYFR